MKLTRRAKGTCDKLSGQGGTKQLYRPGREKAHWSEDQWDSVKPSRLSRFGSENYRNRFVDGGGRYYLAVICASPVRRRQPSRHLPGWIAEQQNARAAAAPLLPLRG